MSPFSLLVKPASADCNLECSYCFYLDKKELYPEQHRHQMSEAVLERLIGSYFSTRQNVYAFGWQGGEPTLMGRAFFRKVTELQERLGRRGMVVSNGLQTNGTMITAELAAHLARYRFLVGLSIDGPPEVHDTYRRRPSGRGSYADTLRAIEHLRRRRVEFNVLTVVSAANVGDPAGIYDHLQGLGVAYHQYIPCVEFDEAGKPQPYAITGRQWGEFLIGIFDRWISGDTGRVSIRHFDSILSLLRGRNPGACYLARSCNQYFVVEWNGDVYPCDFFVEREKRLGNVTTDSFEELASSPDYREFARRKSRWSADCARCRYLRFCAGDCPKMRYRPGEDPSALSWLCEGWKIFYDHSLGELKRVAKNLRSLRPAEPAPAQRP